MSLERMISARMRLWSARGLPARRVRALANEGTDEAAAERKLSARVRLESGLYVVSTPLGNLGDVTLRALSVLKSVSCIYAEDTRHTRKLLSALEIKTPLISCHAHNEIRRAREVVNRIALGEAVAMVSDAGTPVVSDPGERVVSVAIREGLPVIPVPGPSAAITALTGSGLDAGSFFFVGFLPDREGERRKKLENIEDIQATLILYVAPNDLVMVLRACAGVLGDQRNCCIAKELTKIHESFDRGTLQECLDRSTAMEKIKGEITLLIEGAAPSDGDVSDDLILARLQSQFEHEIVPLSEAVRQVSREFGIKKKRVYKLALSLKEKGLL